MSVTKQFSAGGAIFRKTQGGIEWLVTKASASKAHPFDTWRLPKGWLDDEDEGRLPGPKARGETKAEEGDFQLAAIRETEEEAGVKARIIQKIETQKVFFFDAGRRVMKFITYYLMEWTSDLAGGPGIETEKVEWMGAQVAIEKLTHNGEKEILKKASLLLDRYIQESLI